MTPSRNIVLKSGVIAKKIITEIRFVRDTGVNESVAYDVVTQKSGVINMLGKWERREAMLQSLGVYYSALEKIKKLFELCK
jgi:hypothetical protein